MWQLRWCGAPMGRQVAVSCSSATFVDSSMHPGFLCPQGEAAVVKNAVPCLGQLLAAHNPADWPSAIRPFNLLLRWARSC